MPGSASTPNVFATQVGQVPASQLDANWNSLTSYINNREITLGTLASRPAASVSGRLYFANDLNGGTLFEDNGSAWTQIAASVSGSTTLTSPLTLTDNQGGGTGHPFLKLEETGSRTWLAYYTKPAAFSNNHTLTIGPDEGAGLWLNLVSVGGPFPGQRVYIWGSTTVVASHPHTGALPAFAVEGDITVGDIVTFSPAGNAWVVGERLASNLIAATDITHVMCARETAGNDVNGGATIDLYPTQGGPGISDGMVELQAYGKGSGALANHLIFSNRGGTNTVTRRWAMNSVTFYPQADVTYDIGNSAARVRTIYSSQVLASAGNSNTTGFVPAMIGMNAAGGTGSPGDTNENNLKTYQVPNSALATNGDVLRFEATFRCAANNTTKRIRVYFGATALIDSTAIAFNNSRFTITGWIMRTGATAQTAHTQAIGQTDSAAWNSNTYGGMQLSGPTETLSGSVLLRCTVQLGAGAALNDVIQDLLVVEYLRSA